MSWQDIYGDLNGDAKSSGLVLYTTVPVNLFRMGNASGPRLDNVRDQDVPSEMVGEGKAAVRMVRPDGGISTFDGIDKSLADRKWWCIPADIPLPDTIRIVRDKRNPMTGLTHYSIRPARYMTMLEFADGLKALATKATLVFTGASSDAKSGSK